MLVELVGRRAMLAARYEREPLDALLRSLDGNARDGAVTRAVREAMQRADLAADRVPLLPKTCLFRSLARFAALRARRIDARFVMGLPRVRGGDGHAWVEVHGEPFLEDEDVSAMVVTFCYPPRARTSESEPQRRAS